ncbi:Fe(3+)-hydroxamate ABC transporter substrate-binding protein FhuD [Sodalis sp. RH14]|uniref:Fe(3+)-hydroxamate ABC transporter substrate-binding protein FhuD n=1 Tax=Sodalis sp. RH14 TaxID=3394329 RepID=UPI0039B62780
MRRRDQTLGRLRPQRAPGAIATDESPGIDGGRRRLLAALLLSPLCCGLASWGTAARGATDRTATGGSVPSLPYQRIIALEWLPVELLFALGVTPLAVAGTRDYRLWVQEPVLPASIVDVGQRTEPNFELITALKPDLILYSQGYGPRPEQLRAIAPAMGFSFTDGQGRPLTTARAGLLALAQRLDRMPAALAHLASFDRELAEAWPRLASYRRQPLLIFSLMDDRHALIIGGTSLFGQVMDQLALANVWQGENNFWGTAVVGIEQLATLPLARAICLDHGDAALTARVAATPLWQAMPFVRRNMLRTVPAIWIYGATLAALRFCRMLQQMEKQW